MVLGGTASVHGGSGGTQGGNAGAVTIDAAGTIAFTGTFDGRGGPARSGGAAGTAATLKVGETTRPTSIGLTVPLVATGGEGAAIGGDGGSATLEAHGGDLRIGGLGGFVYMFTGNGHDRMSGALIVESDGTIDASGGAGTIGGSARNDGIAWSLGIWPTRQDDEFGVDNIAVLINSDGVHGSDHGWLDNRGHIIARGGATGGNGGDIAYHGRTQDGNETPVPGTSTTPAMVADGWRLRRGVSGRRPPDFRAACPFSLRAAVSPSAVGDTPGLSWSRGFRWRVRLRR